MIRVLSLCVAALCLSLAGGQPLFCKGEDSECSDGNYCDAETLVCRECLSCQDLKREPPIAPNSCIKSVAECGPCNKGLEVDHRGDVNAECVPPDTSQMEPTPSYVWLLIGFGVLLFMALGVGIIAYVFKNPGIFKTAEANPSSMVTARITATAPEAPPPYNTLPYSPVRTESPFPTPAYNYVEPTFYNEDDRPFIKRSSSPSRPNDARESAGHQAAVVYNRPIYDRDPQSPGAGSPDNEYKNEDTHEDEDTVPSPWTPNGTSTTADVNDNVVTDMGASSPVAAGASGTLVALPTLLAAARETTLVEHPANKKRCIRQDSSGNSSGKGSGESSPRPPSPPHAPPPPFSFITQITNVVNINK